MLPLDDPLWRELGANYTNGATVARLLAQAETGAARDVWYEDLFQELLHQYTLSPVAYAAVPWLVAIATKRQDVCLDLLVLAGSCYAQAGDDPAAPAIPSPLAGAWQEARTSALPLVLDLLQSPDLDANEIRYLLAAVAALKEQPSLAVAVEALDTVIQCPQCGHWIEPRR